MFFVNIRYFKNYKKLLMYIFFYKRFYNIKFGNKIDYFKF